MCSCDNVLSCHVCALDAPFLFRVSVVSRPALALAFAALNLQGFSSRPSHITMATLLDEEEQSKPRLHRYIVDIVFL